MNIVTEHSYQKARWSDAEFEALLDGTLTPGEAVDYHNATIITLQGDHGAEIEAMRYINADLLRELHYAEDGWQKAEEKVRRMSDTIRRQGERIKELEAVKPCTCKR